MPQQQYTGKCVSSCKGKGWEPYGKVWGSVESQRVLKMSQRCSSNWHYVKSAQIRSFFWSVFSCIQSEYRKIPTRKNSTFGHFSCSVGPARRASLLNSYVTIWILINWRKMWRLPITVSIFCIEISHFFVTSSKRKQLKIIVPQQQ